MAAPRGSKKRLAQEHEEFVAELYEGKVSPSSGAASTDGGDVRTDDLLIECKTSGSPGKESRSTLVGRMERIAEEAWEEGREPVLCLRYFKPSSVLAGMTGHVDLTVRLTSSDAAKTR